jgi:dual specificity tyrosine-phosphorylation-regulated kinase 1
MRACSERPVYRLSVWLIDTYKHINKVYYDDKARAITEKQKDTSSSTSSADSKALRNGVHNDGYDDQHYDYILQGDEILHDRYILKHGMGKGSFGKVVCAWDQKLLCEVSRHASLGITLPRPISLPL